MNEEVKTKMNTSQMDALIELIEKKVIGQHEMVQSVVFSLFEALNGNTHNILIIGDSGTGKTFLITLATKYLKKAHFNVSCLFKDATEYTEAGCVGKEISETKEEVKKILEETNDLVVVYFDELDKLISPKYFAGHQNRNVQFELLKFLEGDIDGKDYSDRVLFIGSGAFNGLQLEENKKERLIGFCRENEEETTYKAIDYRTALARFGCIHELLGRFTYFSHSKQFTEEDLLKIAKGENGVKKIQKQYSKYGCNISFDDEVIKEIVKRALNSDTGARSINSELSSLAQKCFFDNNKTVCVSKDLVVTNKYLD